MEPQVVVHAAARVDVKWTVPLAAMLAFKGAIVRSVPPTPDRATL
jgi:hypothetical protein